MEEVARVGEVRKTTWSVDVQGMWVMAHAHFISPFQSWWDGRSVGGELATQIRSYRPSTPVATVKPVSREAAAMQSDRVNMAKSAHHPRSMAAG